MKAQIITTIAGGGLSGDGSLATAASVYDPNGAAIDKYGNFFFAENLGNRVRMINNFGIIITVAGTGTPGFNGDGITAISAQINQPPGIAVDTFGNLYIADAQNNRIRKVRIATGIITTVAGNGSIGFSGDGGLATAATLNRPSSVCLDRAGNLYIADDINSRIRKVNTSGIITTIAGNGLIGSTGDGGAATLAKCTPYSICTDNSGNLYIAEGSFGTLRKVNTLGIITTIAGDTTSVIYNGDEIPASNATLDPEYISFNEIGELFIGDTYNNRIRKIDQMGIIHTVAGNGTDSYAGDGGIATSAEISEPSGIAFDDCGNLYIGQVTTPRIRKVTFNPTPCPYLNTNNINEEYFLNIYPNPVYNELNINNIKTSSNYFIINLLGKKMQQGILKVGNNQIDIKYMPTGIYMLEIIDEEKNRTITKILKQ